MGDGTKIRVWEDAWLPGDNVALVPTPNLESAADLWVSDLIRDDGGWDDAALQTHLTEEDARLAKAIPLSSRRTHDLLYWWPATNGLFSTKSSFWLGRIGHIRGWVARFGGARDDVWRTVWNLGGPPKLSHFVWRACMGALATRDRLRERHVLSEGGCCYCQGTPETILHAIFQCSLVSSIWDNSPFSQYLVDGPVTSFVDFLVWLKSKMTRQELLTCMTFA